MKETFFTHDKNFYRNLFSMLVIVALQNVIAYSVNMADNVMLGAARHGRPIGIGGDPRGATAEKGRIILETSARELVPAFIEIRDWK